MKVFWYLIIKIIDSLKNKILRSEKKIELNKEYEKQMNVLAMKRPFAGQKLKDDATKPP